MHNENRIYRSRQINRIVKKKNNNNNINNMKQNNIYNKQDLMCLPFMLVIIMIMEQRLF
jgi:hypothetical protein